MFKIGDFSKLTRVSIRMLRHYDDLSLLKPSRVDRFTGYRFYSAEQMLQLNQILVLKDMGFSLSEILKLKENDFNDDQLRELLYTRRSEILSVIEKENEKLLRVENHIKSINREDMIMKYEIILKEIPAYKVISLRDIIPAYDAEGMLWMELQDFVTKHDLKCGTPCYAIYHDQDYKESNIDVEVTMCVNEIGSDSDRVKYKQLDNVPTMAVVMHSGPFQTMTSAYHALGVWLENNKYDISGPSRAIYHKGPWNEENPENYLTEIQMPVVKRR